MVLVNAARVKDNCAQIFIPGACEIHVTKALSYNGMSENGRWVDRVGQ